MQKKIKGKMKPQTRRRKVWARWSHKHAEEEYGQDEATNMQKKSMGGLDEAINVQKKSMGGQDKATNKQ